MRKTIYILIAVLGLCMIQSCGSSSKNGDSPSPHAQQLPGEWHLTSWNGETPKEFDAYVSFKADGTFEIYQQIEQSRYQKYAGSYSLSGSVLSGVYKDNVAWGSQYEISMDDTAKKLTMTSNSAVKEVSVYTRTAIPDNVKSGAVTVMSVRSEGKRLF